MGLAKMFQSAGGAGGGGVPSVAGLPAAATSGRADAVPTLNQAGGNTVINQFDARGSVGIGDYPAAQDAIRDAINPGPAENSSSSMVVGGAGGPAGSGPG
jgi:hypothetical protein